MNLTSKIEATSALLMVACTELEIETHRIYDLSLATKRGERRVTNYSEIQRMSAHLAKLGAQLALLIEMEAFNLADACEDDSGLYESLSKGLSSQRITP